MIAKTRAGFTYIAEVVDKATGAVREREVVKNLMPIEGINHMIATQLKGGPQINNWYVSVYENAYTPLPSDTMAMFPAAAGENVDYVGSSRPLFNSGAVANGTVDNVGNVIELEFSDDTVIHGGFISSSATKGGTSGVLLSAVRFASPKSVDSSSVLRITAGFIMSSM